MYLRMYECIFISIVLFDVMQEFRLIDKGELAPLQDLVESILQPKWQ